MIVADTSAILALLDADDKHHEALRDLWESDPDAWVLPWAILPEVDYMVRRHLGASTAMLFLKDLEAHRFPIEHSQAGDIQRAAEIDAQYAALNLGLVDGVVAAVAERLRADGIATLDVRHFSVIAGARKIYPRDASYHGKAVAEIRPMPEAATGTFAARIAELEAEGAVIRPTRRGAFPHATISVPGALNRFLEERD